MLDKVSDVDSCIADTGKFNFVEREAARLVGAVMMWGISGRLKKKYDIHGDVRRQLYAAADDWADAVGASRCAWQCCLGPAWLARTGLCMQHTPPVGGLLVG